MIPRLIHQIFLTGKLPPRLQRHIDELKDRNPGWQHHLYDHANAEEFIREHYDLAMLDTYRRINPAYGAARADLLRHLIIYKRGGVYLDIKTDAAKPLDDVLRPDDQYILTQWKNRPGDPTEGFGLHPDLSHIAGGEYQTYHLIAVAGHPFSKLAIDRIERNVLAYKPWSGVGKMGVIRTTGPVAYTLAVHPEIEKAPHRFTGEDELGLCFYIPDYNHAGVFKHHYSTLKSPVARLSPVGRLLQKIVERARLMKQALSA